jgi:polyisoprenoid-binding protein YceI
VKIVLAAFACACAALPAIAQAPVVPPDITPGTYVLNTKEAVVRYTTVHMGTSEFTGLFPGASGTLVFDPAHVETAKVQVRVPISTLETTNRELNGELLSDEFFSEAKFTSMKFVSTSVTRTGPRTADVAGDLSLHGIARPVVLHATLIGARPNDFSKVPTIGFNATGAVKRSDFGMAKYVPIVSDEVRIDISAPFEKQTSKDAAAG